MTNPLEPGQRPSPNDLDLEADDFKQAVGIIESARKAGSKKP
jgi:hypothetical protein